MMDQKGFDLFQTAIQWVKDEDDHPHSMDEGLVHEQGTWGYGLIRNLIRKHTKAGTTVVPVCASSCCLAGNIVLAAGEEFVALDTQEVREGWLLHVDYCLTGDGEVKTIAGRAVELTGLDEDEAEYMFGGSRSAAGLISDALQIARDHGYELTIH